LCTCSGNSSNGRALAYCDRGTGCETCTLCFKQIWKVGKVGKVGMIGRVGKVGKVGKVGMEGKKVGCESRGYQLSTRFYSSLTKMVKNKMNNFVVEI
jgi:hypothetical protein